MSNGKGNTMRTPRHSGLRGRSAVLFILMLAVAVVFVASGSASGESDDAPSRFQAASLTPDSTFTGAKSQTGYLARTDPALLGRTDATRINIFVKYDFDATASYTGGVAGLKATSPSVTGKGLRNRTAAVQAYDAYTAAARARHHGRRRGRGSGAHRPRDLPHRLRRHRRECARERDRRDPQGRRRRRGPAGRAPAAADRRDAEVHRRDRGVAVHRRIGQGRQGRHGRRDRHGHLARASVVPRHRTPCVGDSAPVPVRQRHRPAPRPGLHLQQEARRRLRVHEHLHGRVRSGAGRVLQQRHGPVLGA